MTAQQESRRAGMEAPGWSPFVSDADRAATTPENSAFAAARQAHGLGSGI